MLLTCRFPAIQRWSGDSLSSKRVWRLGLARSSFFWWRMAALGSPRSLSSAMAGVQRRPIVFPHGQTSRAVFRQPLDPLASCKGSRSGHPSSPVSSCLSNRRTSLNTLRGSIQMGDLHAPFWKRSAGSHVVIGLRQRISQLHFVCRNSPALSRCLPRVLTI